MDDGVMYCRLRRIPLSCVIGMQVEVVGCVLVALALWLSARVVGIVGGRAFSLDGKVVVITGAASGIGRRLALKVFQEAAQVTLVLLDIDLDALKRLQTELQQDGDNNRVFVYDCDVSEHRAVDACIARVVDDVAPKHIGVLVNNAGVVMGRSLEELTPEQIQKTLAVNTMAHFWTVKAALPSMKKAPEALLVTVSSVMGMTSSAGLTDYCASKAAVNAFHEALRLELWRDNIKSIRTLLVCPAAVDTGMFDGVLAADDWALKFSRFFIPMLPESEVVDTIYRSMRRGDKLLVSCFSGWRGIALAWAPAISRLLPVPLYDVAIRLGGGLNGMDTFVGKQHTTAKKNN